MEKRKIGRSTLEVAPLVFGGNVFGWTADEFTSFDLLDAFVSADFNLIDTADVYSRWVPGHKGGKYRSEADLEHRPRGPMVKRYMTARGFRILDALDQVAKKHNATPAGIALIWLIARPSITAPIASATNLQQLNSLIEATRIKLDAESLELLNQASAFKPGDVT
jgi:aryl-alcohol dehydrogenase-like predicted oxidoreductase